MDLCSKANQSLSNLVVVLLLTKAPNLHGFVIIILVYASSKGVDFV